MFVTGAAEAPWMPRAPRSLWVGANAFSPPLWRGLMAGEGVATFSGSISVGGYTYADVQWLQWLRQIGALNAFEEDYLEEPFFRWSAPFCARSIMDQCIEVPAAYWPQLVDEECEKLLASGIDGETVKTVRRWLERELMISG
jgi:hypothetical protein